MPEVMRAQFSRAEVALNDRWHAGVMRKFDRKLPIQKDFSERDQIWLYTQRMTGERMMEIVTSVLMELEGRGEKPEDPAISCPHDEVPRDAEAAVMYWCGAELDFCVDCLLATKEYYLDDNSDWLGIEKRQECARDITRLRFLARVKCLGPETFAHPPDRT